MAILKDFQDALIYINRLGIVTSPGMPIGWAQQRLCDVIKGIEDGGGQKVDATPEGLQVIYRPLDTTPSTFSFDVRPATAGTKFIRVTVPFPR